MWEHTAGFVALNFYRSAIGFLGLGALRNDFPYY